MYWLLFIGLTVVMYVAIGFIGQLSGGESSSAITAARKIFTPSVFSLMIIANLLFAVSIFYGFMVTPTALSVSVAVGVITTFIFSCMALGVTVTLTKVLGLACITLGIYLLK